MKTSLNKHMQKQRCKKVLLPANIVQSKHLFKSHYSTNPSESSQTLRVRNDFGFDFPIAALTVNADCS